MEFPNAVAGRRFVDNFGCYVVQVWLTTNLHFLDPVEIRNHDPQVSLIPDIKWA